MDVLSSKLKTRLKQMASRNHRRLVEIDLSKSETPVEPKPIVKKKINRSRKRSPGKKQAERVDRGDPPAEM